MARIKIEFIRYAFKLGLGALDKIVHEISFGAGGEYQTSFAPHPGCGTAGV